MYNFHGDKMNDKYRMLTKIVRNMKIEKAKNESGLNDNESEALRSIVKHPGYISNDIASDLNVDKGLVTRILQKLFKLDLITFQEGLDRRKKHIYPTKKAQEYKLYSQNFEIKYYQELFKNISFSEQETFFLTLEKLYIESKKIRKQKRVKENEETI